MLFSRLTDTRDDAGKREISTRRQLPVGIYTVSDPIMAILAHESLRIKIVYRYVRWE